MLSSPPCSWRTVRECRGSFPVSGRCGPLFVYVYAQRSTVERLKEEAGLITPIQAPISPGRSCAMLAPRILLSQTGLSPMLLEICPPAPLDGGRCAGTAFQRAPTRRDLEGFHRPSTANVPHHLARLLDSLNGFETYSAQCESRNAADAEIHAYLYRMTAHARATVEDALKVLIEFENIRSRRSVVKQNSPSSIGKSGSIRRLGMRKTLLAL